MKTNFRKIATDGVVTQNPTLKLVLGTCPTLALTTMAMNGIYMGLAVTFVLICSNILVSLIRKIVPSQVRIPAFVLIIATFVTIVRLLLDKLLPDAYEVLHFEELHFETKTSRQFSKYVIDNSKKYYVLVYAKSAPFYYLDLRGH
jgi:Na+-translocating ferredoxin:NAD+ oxidoreductase RnfE subunit